MEKNNFKKRKKNKQNNLHFSLKSIDYMGMNIKQSTSAILKRNEMATVESLSLIANVWFPQRLMADGKGWSEEPIWLPFFVLFINSLYILVMLWCLELDTFSTLFFCTKVKSVSDCCFFVQRIYNDFYH